MDVLRIAANVPQTGAISRINAAIKTENANAERESGILTINMIMVTEL